MQRFACWSWDRTCSTIMSTTRAKESYNWPRWHQLSANWSDDRFGSTNFQLFHNKYYWTNSNEDWSVKS